MEEPVTTKPERNKKAMTIKITTGAGGGGVSVGGIGGIVFLGGALVAAATLFTALAFNKNKRRTPPVPPPTTKSSSDDNDVTLLHSLPPAGEEEEETITSSTTDLANELEIMMKSSKDHHHHNQIIKGLNFLLPADSPLPFLPNKSSCRIDAAAETGETRIEPAQLLISDDEKAKPEISGAGYQEIVHEESTPLFDESGIIITREEYSLQELEASELNKNVENSVVSDQLTMGPDSLAAERNEFHSPILLPEPECTKEDEHFSTENSPVFVEAAELLVEDELSTGNPPVSVEAVEILAEEVSAGKNLLPLVDSALVFGSESMDRGEFSMERSPVLAEAVGLLEEEDGLGKNSLPLLNIAVAFGSESMTRDEFSIETSSVVAEAVGLQVEDCKVKSLSPLLDSALLSKPESANEDELSKENPPLAVEAVELLEEDDSEGKNSLSLLDSALVSGSESMNMDRFSTETSPIFAEAIGLQVVKSSLTLLDSAEPESINIDNFSMETPPVFDKDFELLEEDCEANNAGTDYEDLIEVENEPDVCDAIVQETILDNVDHEIPQEDQVTDDKETFEKHDEVNLDSEQLVEAIGVKKEGATLEKRDGEIFDFVPLVEAIEGKKEGETSDKACNSIGVGEKLEVRLIGEELEEVKDVEENRNEIPGVDWIIAEDTEEVKLIGNEGEKDDDIGEACLDQVAEEEEPPLAEEVLDLLEVADVYNPYDPIRVEGEAECDDISTETTDADEGESTEANVGEKDDDIGESNVEKCEKTSTEARVDQVAEEEEPPLTEEVLDLLEVADVYNPFDPIRVEGEAKCDDVSTKTTDADEGESTETTGADEHLESLEYSEKEKCDEVRGNVIEDESMETADVDELENGENDNGSRSLITEQEITEPMADGGRVLDSGKVPPSIESADADETACVDQVSVEEDSLPIQPTEEVTIVEHVVEKTPRVESSDEEDGDSDGEESEDDVDEESSQGTGDLSIESNYDAVWPAESIQEQLSFKPDKVKTNNQTPEEGENPTAGDEDDENIETIQSYVMRELANQRRPVEPWKVKSWAWSMLVMLWCFCHWYLGLPFVKVSLVALVISIVVLFGFPNHVKAKQE